MLATQPCAVLCKHDLPKNKNKKPSHKIPYIGACVLLANLSTPCATAVLFARERAVLLYPCWPSSMEEAPSPRSCVLASRPCAVFCMHERSMHDLFCC